MYNQWLFFFNSPLNEIEVKNKKEKQVVKKEFLSDGDLKISGDKPSEWYVLLNPLIVEDIYTVKYKIEQSKLEAQYLIKKAFEYKDEKLFTEGEKMYNEALKKEKDLQNIFESNQKLLKDISEKIFEVKRDIYLGTSNKKDVSKLKTNLTELLFEKINIQKIIKEKENNVVFRPENIITDGPFPDPPVIKSLVIKKQTVKTDDIKPDKIKVDKVVENKKGGSIKVIRI